MLLSYSYSIPWVPYLASQSIAFQRAPLTKYAGEILLPEAADPRHLRLKPVLFALLGR